MLGLFAPTGRMVETAVQEAGHGCVLLGHTLVAMATDGWRRVRSITDQLYICGAQSLLVALLVGAFSGMILALQTGLELRRFGVQGILGVLILISLLRELGPFMCAFILAGRVGSAMAAELGTMAVSEEIDALHVMSIDPVKLLVVPRFVALALAAPMLTIFVDVIGVIGGGIVAKYQVGVAPEIYYRGIWEYLEGAQLSLLYGGLFKAVIFGMLIAIVGCSNGLRATGGAKGVGEASRKTVVHCFLLILALNYFMSSLIKRLF